MTTGQEDTRNFQLGIADTQLGIKVKSPKLAVGFLELGLAAHYSLADLKDEDKKVPSASLKRFKATLSVKDIILRGKFELEPQERKLHYSKKFRLPFANTDLLKLRLTAAWPSAEAAGGLLGRGLGVSLSLAPPERLPADSLLRQPPYYSMALAPRLGPPQALYDKMCFPGSVYLKPRATLRLTDAPTVAGLRARLDVASCTAVVRLYDPERVKPSRLGRNLAAAARRLVLEEEGADGEAAGRAGASQARTPLEPEPLEPDVIDRAAAKAREWAHAVLVNSCVATRHLQEQAAAAGQRLQAMVGGKAAAGGGGSS